MNIHNRLAEFELQFKALLPNSFDDVLPYVRSKLGGGAKLPRYRSPSDRHALMVPLLIAPNGEPLPNLFARLGDASEKGRKNELIAALVSPFDQIENWQSASEALARLLQDCERLSEEQLASLVKTIGPSSLGLMWDAAGWWLRQHFAPALLRFLALATGILIFLRYVLRLGITTRKYHAGSSLEFRPFPALMLLRFATMVLLCFATGSARRLFSFLRLVLFAPVIIAGKLLFALAIWLPKKISKLPYESLEIENRYRLQTRAARLDVAGGAIVAAGVSMINIAIFPGTLWSGVHIAVAFGSVLLVLLWFYFWNFQPLLFLQAGVRTFVFLSTVGVARKRQWPPQRWPPRGVSHKDAANTVERLNKLRLFVDRMRELSGGVRFNIFSANCFVLLLLLILALILVQYSMIFWGLYSLDHSFFQPMDAAKHALRFQDFVILSLNNAPFGGSLNARGGTFGIELALFSERFVLTALLVLAVFTYSVVSNGQIEAEKGDLVNLFRRYLEEFDEEIETYKQLAGERVGKEVP